MEKIIVTLWITFGIYLMVLLAIMIDLWSGVRKAKKNGIADNSNREFIEYNAFVESVKAMG